MKTGKMKPICYDISSLIRKKPELKTCPSCQAILNHREVEHSRASRAFEEKASQPVVSTCFHHCPDCGWWAVRELRADHELYDPPVEEFIVLDAVKNSASGCKGDAALLERILADNGCWKNPVPIPSTDAIELFGSAQMLLPNLSTPSRDAVFDRVKSIAPILLPILFIILIAVLYAE